MQMSCEMFLTLMIPYLVQEEEVMGNVKRQLAKLFESSLRAIVPDEPDVEPLIAACTGNFGDYQW